MPGFLRPHGRLLRALCWHGLPGVPPAWVGVASVTPGEVTSGRGYRDLRLFAVCFSNWKSEKPSGLARGGVCRREHRSASTWVLIPAPPPSPMPLQYPFSLCRSLTCEMRPMMFSLPGRDEVTPFGSPSACAGALRRASGRCVWGLGCPVAPVPAISSHHTCERG